MSSHFLPVFRANAEDDAEELEARLSGTAGSVAALTRACRLRRVAAIAALLMDADAGAFREQLLVSVGSLRHWLAAKGADGLALSRCQGLFDSLALAEQGAARNIASALALLAWQPQAEYEEDYLYMKLLVSRLVAGEEGAGERLDWLARYRNLVGEGVDFRLELCAALEAKEAAAFESALEGLMLARRDEYDELRARDALPPEELATLAHVSIEGVALWRLGREQDFALQSDYLFIPSPALAEPGALGLTTP